jgi:hypothetical protein
VNQLEVREENFEEETWDREMKRWVDWVKGHEKSFGKSVKG